MIPVLEILFNADFDGGILGVLEPLCEDPVSSRRLFQSVNPEEYRLTFERFLQRVEVRHDLFATSQASAKFLLQPYGPLSESAWLVNEDPRQPVYQLAVALIDWNTPGSPDVGDVHFRVLVDGDRSRVTAEEMLRRLLPKDAGVTKVKSLDAETFAEHGPALVTFQLSKDMIRRASFRDLLVFTASDAEQWRKDDAPFINGLVVGRTEWAGSAFFLVQLGLEEVPFVWLSEQMLGTNAEFIIARGHPKTFAPGARV